MEIVAPINNVIIQMETKYIKNFTSILKMAAIQNNTSIDPSDYVNIIGTVISAPKSISDKRDHVGFSANDIKKGDTIIFSHQVVYDFLQTDPDAEPIYKNLFWYKGKEYWIADISKIYAVIRNGEIRMQNGYVMVEELEKAAKIFLPAHISKNIRIAKGVISQSRPSFEGKQGDHVFFNPKHPRLYQINGKEFAILTEDQILGRKNTPLEILN